MQQQRKLLLNAFTDAKFLSAVRTAIGKTNGEHIYSSDVENIKTLDVAEKDITSLNGIEYFTGLEELDCYATEIAEIDCSQNVNLKKLDCSYNMEMTSLNVSNMQIHGLDVLPFY